MLIFFKCLVLLFGVFELSTNTIYLIMKNGVSKAYKQHKELPGSVPESRMKAKVITMEFIGTVFFLAGLHAVIFSASAKVLLSGILAFYAMYNWCESIYYRHHIGFALAAFVTLLAFSCYLFT